MVPSNYAPRRVGLNQTKFASKAIEKFKGQGTMCSSMITVPGWCFLALASSRLNAFKKEARGDSSDAKVFEFAKRLVRHVPPSAG